MIEYRADVLVMRVLLQSKIGFTFSSLQKYAGLNYQSTKSAVERLNKKGLVIIEAHGLGEVRKIRIVKANFDHPKIEALKQILLESVIPEGEPRSSTSSGSSQETTGPETV